jgi:polyisoprenyl-phosphate glycosyltransferase
MAAIKSDQDSPSIPIAVEGVVLLDERTKEGSERPGSAYASGDVADKKHIIVLTATLNDWDSIPDLLVKLDDQFVQMDVRATVVVVDDGSSRFDGVSKIAGLPLRSIRSVVAVVLHRNVGNQNAIAVGLGYLVSSFKGDYVVVMDCDHEDDPIYVPKLFRACQEQQDKKIVFAARTERSEGSAFVAMYTIYRHLYRVLTGASISVGNYCMIPWRLAKRIAHISELWGHFPVAIMKAGIPFSTIPAVRGRRLYGRSSMNLVRLLVHAANALAVHAETVAVRIILAAAGVGVAAALAIAFLLALKAFTNIPLLGWTSQIVGIMLILLFQIFVTVCMMTFTIVALRLRPPNMPAFEFEKFILEVEPLYVAPAELSADAHQQSAFGR